MRIEALPDLDFSEDGTFLVIRNLETGLLGHSDSIILSVRIGLRKSSMGNVFDTLFQAYMTPLGDSNMLNLILCTTLIYKTL